MVLTCPMATKSSGHHAPGNMAYISVDTMRSVYCAPSVCVCVLCGGGKCLLYNANAEVYTYTPIHTTIHTTIHVRFAYGIGCCNPIIVNDMPPRKSSPSMSIERGATGANDM